MLRGFAVIPSLSMHWPEACISCPESLKSMTTLLEEVRPRIETPFRTVYGNFIGSAWVPPINGRYFDNLSPVDGELLCRIPRSDGADVDAALDAAHAAKDKWAAVSPAE